jgi:DNA-directed RNA polymerase specialized sigma subunit
MITNDDALKILATPNGVEDLILALLPEIRKRDDEIYSISCYGLVKACNKCKDLKHPFVLKFIWRVIHGYRLNYLTRQKHNIELIEGAYESSMKTLYDDSIEVFMSKITETDRKILSYLLEGLKEREISALMDVTQSYVSHRRSYFKVLIRGYK